jgi:hypothetical protein
MENKNTFSKNLVLRDYDDYGLQSSIIKVSIEKNDFKKLLIALEKSKEIGIDNFEVSEWFQCDETEMYYFDEDRDGNAETVAFENLSKANICCLEPEFFCKDESIRLKIDFKDVDGCYENEEYIGIRELKEFFGCAIQDKATSIQNAKSVQDLDKGDLIFFIQKYNEYIIDFDYGDGGQPVCVDEFFDCEFQEILETI